MVSRGHGDFPYGKAACCDALDVRVLGLMKGLDKVWTDQDSTDDTLLHGQLRG